jgi:hypothetical protein
MKGSEMILTEYEIARLAKAMGKTPEEIAAAAPLAGIMADTDRRDTAVVFQLINSPQDKTAEETAAIIFHFVTHEREKAHAEGVAEALAAFAAKKGHTNE